MEQGVELLDEIRIEAQEHLVEGAVELLDARVDHRLGVELLQQILGRAGREPFADVVSELLETVDVVRTDAQEQTYVLLLDGVRFPQFVVERRFAFIEFGEAADVFVHPTVALFEFEPHLLGASLLADFEYGDAAGEQKEDRRGNAESRADAYLARLLFQIGGFDAGQYGGYLPGTQPGIVELGVIHRYLEVAERSLYVVLRGEEDLREQTDRSVVARGRLQVGRSRTGQPADLCVGMAEESLDQRLCVGIPCVGVRGGLFPFEQPVDHLPGFAIPFFAHEFIRQMALVDVRIGGVEGENLIHIVGARCRGLSDQVRVREVFDGGVAEAQPGGVVSSQKGAGQLGGVDLAVEQVGRFEVVSGRGVEVGDLDAGFVDPFGVSGLQGQFEVGAQVVEGRVELIGGIGVGQQTLHAIELVRIVATRFEQFHEFPDAVLFQVVVHRVLLDGVVEPHQITLGVLGLMCGDRPV